MRLYRFIFCALCGFALSACAAPEKTETPLDALKIYNQAVRDKDAARIKDHLSKGSLKMAQDEAAAQNVSIDEIVQRETIYSPSQRSVKVRNQKIDGDRATIEVENARGAWDVVPFVREDGTWKIAKDRYADELMKQVEEENKRRGEEIDRERRP